MLKIIRVILYSIGGLFIFGMNMMSFIKTSTTSGTLDIANEIGLIVSCAIGAVFLLAAAVTSRFCNCKRSLGIVFLSSAGVTMFMALWVFCALSSNGIKKFFPLHAFDLFGNYLTGCLVTFTLSILGLLLIYSSPKTE